jgi:hypothetical protein
VVIELKQWTEAETIQTMPGMVRAGGRLVQHPARQVGCYVRYLRDWVANPQLPLHVEGLALLHNAPEPLVKELRRASATHPVLGADDLDQPTDLLAAMLHCTDLRPASPHKLTALLDAAHRPSPGLLARAGKILEGHDALTLIDEQDAARQHILCAIDNTRKTGRKGLIVVTGGPGSGKTAIACRLFGDLCGQPGSNPRLYSPSGTITRQLRRLVHDEDVQKLIRTLKAEVPGDVDDRSVILLDEAHRARTYPNQARRGSPTVLSSLIKRAGVTVMFLDERQIIRPDEGITLTELRSYAADNGIAFADVNLTTQFRCNGSTAYLRWVDEFLEPSGTAPPWTGCDYDLAAAHDPEELTRWVQEHTRNGHTARITAGFCWPWESPAEPPLLPEVEISWSSPNGTGGWARPWNARAEELDDPHVPARSLWATDPGGHDQVGCIYTAQGMEYDYNAVIIGNDLVRRGDRWIAQPQASHDPALAGLPPERYLPYALNTYRVLTTRGTKGARLYSTDTQTQTYLRTLLRVR